MYKKVMFAIMAVIVLLLGTTLLPQKGIAQDTSVSGAVYLPNGITAPAGGLIGSAIVRIEYDSEGNSYSERSGQFNIPEGQSSAGYNVTVPMDSSITGYRVSYYFSKNNGYVERGWYSATGTTCYKSSATLLNTNAGGLSGINLFLLKGNTISGTISLPAGDTAINNVMPITVITSANSSDIYYEYVKIPAGRSSVEFQETVPVDESIAGYSIRYSLSNSNYPHYVEKGYYSAGGTTSANLAMLVNANGGDVAGINLTVLKGSIISGTISLPGSLTAPAGGISGNIIVESSNRVYRYYKYFSIAANAKSAAYSLTIPVDASITGYRVNYSIYSNDYVQYGYYSTEGTTKYGSATLVNLNTDVSNVALTLLIGNTVSGTVSLPQGRKAPAEGIEGYIYNHSFR